MTHNPETCKPCQLNKPVYVVHGKFDEHGKQIPGSCSCEICTARARYAMFIKAGGFA